MSKFDKLYKSIISEQHESDWFKKDNTEAIQNSISKYGNDFVIINGTDNWNGCPLFFVSNLLKEFGIKPLEQYHDGLSHLAKSGNIISKDDLQTFIDKFNENKLAIREKNLGEMYKDESIKIFDPATNSWKTFFEIRYGDTQRKRTPDEDGTYACKKQAIITVDNFEPTNKDISKYFNSDEKHLKSYWVPVPEFVDELFKNGKVESTENTE